MGRPLNKKYFGNRNIPSIGGEGVASVTVGGTNNNYSAFPTIAFAAPSLPDGVQATGTVRAGVVSVSIAGGGTLYAVNDVLTIVGGTGVAATLTVTSVDAPETGVITGLSVTTAGDYSAFADLTDLNVTGSATGSAATITVTALKINSVVMTVNGSGYTTAPAITDTPDGNATLTAVLATAKENAIVAYAYVTGNNLIADIKKQVSSRRYKVKTSEGTLTCKLVTDGVANAVGEMTITATDSEGNTYYVSKLTAHKATLVQIAGGSNYVYASGKSAPWSFAAASGSVVQIANK